MVKEGCFDGVNDFMYYFMFLVGFFKLEVIKYVCKYFNFLWILDENLVGSVGKVGNR